MVAKNRAGKKRILHYLLALIILVVLVVGGVKLHKKRSTEVTHVPSEPLAPWALHVAEASNQPVDSGFPALATVSTREEVSIMARISGRILEMGPREGVRVKTGDLLVRMDTLELEDTIKSLKAQLIAAQATARRGKDELVRETKLFKSGGSNESAVEARHTAFVAATQKISSLEHEIKALQVRKGYGKIKAPADGIIAKRLAEPGDMATPGRPLYKITTSAGALVRVELPQSVLHEIHPGTVMVLTHGGDKLVFPINRIFPSVDARALGWVEADVDKIPFGLPSGSRVACRIILKRVSDSIQVPYHSLLCGDDPQQCRLFKVVRQNNKDILRMVPVTVILRGHDGIAVKGGLTAKDRVIVAHESVLLQLKDGDPVTIAKGEMP